MRRSTIAFISALMLMTGCSDRVEQRGKGWPEKNPADLRSSFINPPAGYGNVPFYWWSADTLKIDRLQEQLDMLSEAYTDGLCISYNHLHYQVDTLPEQKKHGIFGALNWGNPKVMSDEWFSIWNDFSARCAKKGIGLGMDDYVIAWPGNHTYVDSILASEDLKNYPGRLKKEFVHKDSLMPENILSKKENGDGFDVIYAAPSHELHPEFGKRLVDGYFGEFESHMDKAGRQGMNYFFQDELIYDLTMQSWCLGMDSIFMARKGYDIMPYLDMLLITDDKDVDETAAKVRMDYAEVLTDLAEERYFKPIYDWNADRGLIYGCDNVGRGLDPRCYLDYYRAISWFTAPGNDAPARGSSFRQTKVSSSISHVYGRPRAWLEAFHSMGWDANGGVLLRQLDHHLIAGGNLLCMHGLYYSTHGGWWEWAPPCFHFRMPYWPHMKHWLKYAERMCYILSQGSHVCDIAILYPTETMQAYPQSNCQGMFNAAMDLSCHGLDYDFIDYKSLQNSSIADGSMKINDESYKILVLADIKAMHSETSQKIEEFKNAGGIVITSVDNIVSDVRAALATADFSTASGTGKVLHRHASEYDVYMVMDVKEGDAMTFRATGKPELWDALHGTFQDLPVAAADETTRTIISPKDSNSMVIVFSPGDYTLASTTPQLSTEKTVSHIEGEWDIEIIPTMNNKWGDYRLPANDGYIGVEAREMSYDGRTEVYGYAPYMRLAVVDSTKNIDNILPTSGKLLDWEPYSFSWQYGVMDSPGSQGFHGLKAKVDDRFLILDRGGHQIFEGDLFVKTEGKFNLVTLGTSPYKILLDDKSISDNIFNLTAGWHKLTVAYKSAPKASYTLSGMRGSTVDPRLRSMVMVYPEGSGCSAGYGLYDTIVASKWYGTDFVPLGDKQDKEYTYSFKTAPGTVSMDIRVNGTISSVKVDGNPLETKDGHTYSIPSVNPNISEVVVSGKPELGYHGAAFFAKPVEMTCKGGKLQEGDWTQAGALKFFSGGIKYSKDIEIASSSRITLDLGKVDATAEVFLNGKSVDVLLSSPYTLDITDYVKPGTNRLEVLVYSSLSNHYQTIPTPYRGTATAGLFGPVTITTY